MAPLAPKSLTLSECERQDLEKLLNRRSTAQQIALRAQIILLADQGNNNREIGRELNVSRFMARRWRNRWLELRERSIPVIERLKDQQRSGTPAKFKTRILDFIDYFNRTMAKPFKWTYKGKVLAV